MRNEHGVVGVSLALPFGALLLAAAVAAAPRAARSAGPARADVLSWFEMSPARFGCWMERALRHRDPRWNCDLKGWKASGDPCEDVQAWLEGPGYPDALARRVHPRVRKVDLDWEHGDLRAVTAHFEGDVTEAAAREALRLPPEGAPEGFGGVYFQRCSRAGPCLTIERFEHMGAGEADCGGSGD